MAGKNSDTFPAVSIRACYGNISARRMGISTLSTAVKMAHQAFLLLHCNRRHLQSASAPSLCALSTAPRHVLCAVAPGTGNDGGPAHPRSQSQPRSQQAFSRSQRRETRRLCHFATTTASVFPASTLSVSLLKAVKSQAAAWLHGSDQCDGAFPPKILCVS